MMHKSGIGKRLMYLMAFVILLLTEILIGRYVHDRMIRPYGGDVLVIMLLCCFVRVFLPERPRLLGIYMMAAGVAAEISQAFHLAERLGLGGTVWGIILGSTFDWKDILCYVCGGLLFVLAEGRILRRLGSGRDRFWGV